MMGFLFKIAALGLLLLLVSACFRKKAGAGNLQEWLELHYPGRFRVLSTESDDAIRQMTFQTKKSIVAETADPLVQAQIKWDKRQAEFGLSTASIEAAFAEAQRARSDAAEWNRALRELGLKHYALGLRDRNASVLLFDRNTPDLSRESLELLEKGLDRLPAAGSYEQEILLMDTTAGPVEDGAILPLSYFLEGNGQYRKQVLYSLVIPPGRSIAQALLPENWQFNTRSDRFMAAYRQAYAAMESWAQEHVREPYRLLDLSESGEIGRQPLRYRFEFAFVSPEREEEAADEALEPDGYFLVDYDLEGNTVLQINLKRK